MRKAALAVGMSPRPGAPSQSPGLVHPLSVVPLEARPPQPLLGTLGRWRDSSEPEALSQRDTRVVIASVSTHDASR